MTSKTIDTSHEAVRVYTFGTGKVEIEFPLTVRESEDGHHYVTAKDGFGTIVPPGWIGIDVEPISGASPFAF